ncbi:hypothetical protein ASPVEDRAFT_290508 [Aspergillus versicolor CBS 583.65]|uniref:Uncharacterized protein n=1 Tax=Aspergillus versicolor CBS 583.65 TaxID=1036611 RepID=A0A1L9P7B7_ASPVE|nr:uncharacterized protein ASPVEDRAFT_290508 [Aspergillus versicolor CBS 583.65]OJI97405.1 hypothetical protein ASPVEDRAFT_290508 [Aspergillus versicolor CBS 583.65]
MGSKFIKFDSRRKGHYASSESDRPEETRAIHQNSKQAHVKQAPAPSSSKRSALPSPPSGNLHTLWRDESRTRFWYDRAISFTTICFWPENESGLVDLSGGRRIRALAGRLCSHPKQVETRTPAKPRAAYSQHYYSSSSAQRQVNIERKEAILPFQSNPCEHPSADANRGSQLFSFSMGWPRGFAYASFYFWEASRPSNSWLVCLLACKQFFASWWKVPK